MRDLISTNQRAVFIHLCSTSNMADSHDAVSGYRENFPSETQAFAERSDDDLLQGYTSLQESNGMRNFRNYAV